MSIRLVNITGFNSCDGFTLANLTDVQASDTQNFIEGQECKSATGDIINLPTLHIYMSGGSFVARGVNDADLGVTGYISPENFDFYGFAFAVDDERQVGSIVACYKVKYGWYYINCNSFGNAESNANYQAIIGAEQPLYTWTTVPSISGKLGNFALSRVNDEDLNDGNPVTDALDDVIRTVSSQTYLPSLMANVPLYNTVEAIYAGQADYLAITPVLLLTDTVYSLSFNMAGSTFYTVITGSGDAYLQFLIDDENEVAKLSVLYKLTNNPNTWAYNEETMTDEQMSQMYLWLHSHIEEDDEDEQLDNGDNGGSGVDPWNDIPVGGLSVPAISAIATGFTSMYMVTVPELQALSRFLWSDDFVDNVKKFFDDPREILVGISIMPLRPLTDASPSIIKAGGITTNVSGYKLTSQYKLLDDVATCTIKKENGNFLDFPPFTRITAHIPFCGSHALDVNDIMGHVLKLSYIFDFLTGACVAMIKVDDKPRYFFSGTTGIQIPTSSEDFGRTYSSILSAGATIGTTLATVASGGLTAPLMFGAGASMVANGMNMTPEVTHTSGGGSITGMLTSQSAFLIVELPKAKKAKKQYSFTGRPSFLHRQLSECEGFTKVLDVHLTDLVCTEEERKEIDTELRNGVIIETGSQGENEPNVTPTTSGNFVIVFLKMTSEQNVIGKSWKTGNGEELKIEGKLLHNQNISKPSVLIDGSAIGFNYCYIPAFERFYYIVTQTMETGAISRIELRSDPLQSFKTAILNSYAVIERQEKSGNYNAYFGDNQMWTQQDKKIITAPFMSDGSAFSFDRSDNVFILTIAGGE